MTATSNELRELVLANSLELGRISRDTLGTKDYNELTALYRAALDALTAWAAHDYKHIATTEDSDNAYNACKAILALFATDENRIIIDGQSMRTLRDLATKPKREYSDAYKKAVKALKEAKAQLAAREEDLATLGIELPTEEQKKDFAAWNETITGDRVIDGLDRVDFYIGIHSTIATREKAIEDIKAAGNWTWKRPVAVKDNEFAELVENYIADCLVDNYNIKTSKTVRDEEKAKRDAKKAANN